VGGFEFVVALVHVVGVEHLVTFVAALHQFVLEIVVAEVEEIQDAVDTHLVVTLRLFVELHLLPLLVGGRVAPPRTVHEEVFGQTFDRDYLLSEFDVEGVEVAP
jgi:hypothetical protein